MSERRFPPPWTLEKIPGGLNVCDANGQSLAYVYSRENPSDAHIAKVLTEDEARRIASNIAKLPSLLAKGEKNSKALQSYGDDVSGFGASDARFSFLDAPLANLTKTTISSTSLLKVSRPSISTNSRPLQRTQRRFSDLMGASSERPSFLSSPLSET